MIKLSFLFCMVFILLSGCSGSGGTNSAATNTSGKTTGNLTLAGDDTAIVGSRLNAGFIGASLASELQPDYIVIVDQVRTLTFTPPNILIPNINNPDDGFVIVVTGDRPDSGMKDISMSIISAGIKLNYACTSPVATFIDCGTDSISLDIPNRNIVFNNAQLINTESGSLLTINGRLNWNENNIPDTVNGALTDISGVWKSDVDGYFWTSDRGEADEVYDIYNTDNTYVTLGYYADEDCYDTINGDYEDFGSGNISIDGDEPYNFIATGDTLTISYLGDSYTAARTNLTKSNFMPICS